MVLVFLVTQLPFLFTIGASFMNWNAYYPDERRFNGGANFKTVLTDPAARKAIWVTVLLT